MAGPSRPGPPACPAAGPPGWSRTRTWPPRAAASPPARRPCRCSPVAVARARVRRRTRCGAARPPARPPARLRPSAASALPRAYGTGEDAVYQRAAVRNALCLPAPPTPACHPLLKRCDPPTKVLSPGRLAPSSPGSTGAESACARQPRRGAGPGRQRWARRAAERARRACTKGMTSAMTSWPTTLATSVRQVPPAIARFHAPSSRSCARGAARSNASAQRPAAPARPSVGQSLAAASQMQARVSLTFA